MSCSGQSRGAVVVRMPLRTGFVFDWHRHPTDQLAWAGRGVLRVWTDVGTWVLPPSLALWIPAGTAHATGASTDADICSPYFEPGRGGPGRLTAVSIDGLQRELVGHLAAGAAEAHAHAEALLLARLRPVDVPALRVRMPAEPRARAVAEALLEEPGQATTLPAWGRRVGASARTLARVWAVETGLGFDRWRTEARLQASLRLLAEGWTVAAVAHRVGYATPSAFGAAFRRTLGVSPGAFFPR